MKKYLRLLLVLIPLILSACQNNTSTETKHKESSTSQSSRTSTTNKKYKLSKKGSYYSLTNKYGQEIIIVNKKHPLSADYAPGENATAKAALMELISKMQSLGYDVSQNYSGYRSYETQTQLYQSYVNKDGKEQADTYSARAGYSEHQTGLAFDLIDNEGNLLEETNASKWLLEHASDFGFIVRYQKSKESITGYQAESWHLRYIGKEAKAIAKSGLSLEEYYGITGGNYN
ncbi:hypothetical protein HMPREF9318_02017 [Streptococcus urinalis FB127-CNA-2]|uniref:Serine-type D-Ala-D-Ala carboxypeptidase n=1 Tax=Streptococcus urinalis 2285-97 TaxID=764291 RepID=G5KCT9_9STRE|nr:LD-carboxypeptidase LdcB/DacB [Streptococcus urinalis]EHJ57121.1 serine-type D-Ala-D-Ala carboxypeptidase [Streptococcus urinalis 2285-97]EKS17140.1 hypothetical protein HMPREF9318_02017 [Streptococcus urinalis FB127-CNA-2]VEF32610.1 D-alanyl-D-alanine carboxypeptidase [Streptococcus urinalis]